ncbi:MAG TPA: GntR family transcriptional regulator [Verrucomicrobiae bacterium]|jgi:GntR family transcriptional regulator|nr:GntR family transcriptional regulator [Verrucomicrobiae bacterium]
MAVHRLEPGPPSLYFQLHQHLVERIRAGEFGPSVPLPTEMELCEQYGVSRITVRRALDALADERLISRRRGVRTFVVEPPVKSIALTGSLDDALSYSGDLSLKLLSTEEVRPSPVVAQALGLGAGERVRRLEAIAASAGEPFAYAEYFLPRAVSALFDPTDLQARVPVLRAIEHRLGRRITSANQTVEPVIADRVVADYLGMKPRAPLLKVVRTYFTAEDMPVKTDIVRYHPERYRYTVQLFSRRET